MVRRVPGAAHRLGVRAGVCGSTSTSSPQTGKTLSLLSYAERRPQQRFLYITFNAAAARAARARFPGHVDCRTMHSVALQHVTLPKGQALQSLRPRDVVQLLEHALPKGESTQPPAAGKSAALAPTTVACYVLRTLDKFVQSTDAAVRADAHVPKQVSSATTLRPDDLAALAQALWEMIRAGTSPQGRAVPCPHDAYVKQLQLQGGLAPRFLGSYNALLLDEAQDLSACQTAILLGARGHCGVIVVGDVHQKIYGFRGGSATAFHERMYPPTQTFQLTQSFRFGHEVARLATQILGLKAPPPWHAPAKTGAWVRPRLTGRGHDTVAYRPPTMARPYTCVYRTNALLAHDLLQLAVTLPPDERIFLKMSQSFTVGSLTDLLRDGHRLFHGHLDQITPGSPLREFIAWKELAEHVEAEEGGNTKLTLVLSLEAAMAEPDFPARIDHLQTKFCAREDEAAVVLTTVHQAKGLEWDRVAVADDFSPGLAACAPTPRAQVAQLGAQDELNHMYVAMTRARHALALPTCVLAWLVARSGRFRFRFAEKKKSTVCPQCHARACLVQMCVPYYGSGRFDDHVATLGCLACVRPQLSTDEDLQDFVRWIDASGVSTTTGKLSSAQCERVARHVSLSSPAAKRARRDEAPPFAAAPRALRAETYADAVAARAPLLESWMAAAEFWLAKAAAAPGGT